MRPPWLSQDAVSILGVQHDLPKNFEKFLPKFDPVNKSNRLLKTLLIDSCYLLDSRMCKMNMWHSSYSHTHVKERHPHGILIYLKAQL